MPKNDIALDLSGLLKKPITATSANVAGEPDCYSAAEIIKQYKNQKHKPDIVINVGKLPRRKPSTIVKIDGNKHEVIRKGPVSVKKILNQKS
jgi:L-threonylcarbamoyladenylate synthase